MDDIELVKQTLGGYNHDPEYADLYQALSRVIADAERYRRMCDGTGKEINAAKQVRPADMTRAELDEAT